MLFDSHAHLDDDKYSEDRDEVTPRDDHSKTGIDCCKKVEKPQKGYTEMCFYHKLSGKPEVSIYNPDIKKGMKMTFDTKELKCFTQWKMMGEYDYVMGLEPGNCTPDGRDVMREKGMLEFIKAGEEKTQTLRFEFIG